MKRLTERAHQIRGDLTVADAAYFWHASFWRITVHSGL